MVEKKLILKKKFRYSGEKRDSRKIYTVKIKWTKYRKSGKRIYFEKKKKDTKEYIDIVGEKIERGKIDRRKKI